MKLDTDKAQAMSLNIDELKAAALAATPGEWLYRTDPGNPAGFQHCVRLPGEFGAWVCDCLDNADKLTAGGIAGERNAAYIAAANPTVVLSLIVELEQLRAARSAGLSQEPVAYAIFASNSNVRIWFGDFARATSWAVVHGADPKSLVPLYTAPPAPVSAEPRPEDEAEEDAAVIHKLATILAGVCVALKGEELELHRHSYHDIVEVAQAIKLELDLYRMQAASTPPSTDAKDSEFISAEDFSTLFEFNEQAQDSEADGYTASKEEMKRLAELGVVQSLGFGRYSVTSFGSWLIEKRFEQDTRLPLRTSAEHEKREHDAWKAYCDQMTGGDTAWINLSSDVQHQWRERAAIDAAKEPK